MKPCDFSASSSGAPTKPLTFDDLERLLEELRRPAPEKLPPTHDIDFTKAAEHGIRMGWDGLAEMWMMSSSEMARAKSVGAIRPLPHPVTA